MRNASQGFTVKLFWLTMLLSVPSSSVYGQAVKIDTLVILKSSDDRFQNIKLKFPIINSGQKSIDKTINNDIKNRFTGNEFPTLSTKLAIDKWADEQIVYLDFVVTFNQYNLLSLSISAEGCGANCTGWTEYYNYNLTTGKFLKLNDLINNLQEFEKLVSSDKAEQYNHQRILLKKLLSDSKSDLNIATYESALTYYNECDDDFKLEQFSIHKGYLDIIANCHLPNAIKNLTPTIKLQYAIISIRHLLNSQYKHL